MGPVLPLFLTRAPRQLLRNSPLSFLFKGKKRWNQRFFRDRTTVQNEKRCLSASDILVLYVRSAQSPRWTVYCVFFLFTRKSGPFQSQTKMGRREKPFGRLLPMKIFFSLSLFPFSSLSLLYPQFPNTAIPSFIGSNGCSHFSEQREEKKFSGWTDFFGSHFQSVKHNCQEYTSIFQCNWSN